MRVAPSRNAAGRMAAVSSAGEDTHGFITRRYHTGVSHRAEGQTVLAVGALTRHVTVARMAACSRAVDSGRGKTPRSTNNGSGEYAPPALYVYTGGRSMPPRHYMYIRGGVVCPPGTICIYGGA